MTGDGNNLEDSLSRLFGEPISTYTDDQAVADGVLVPLIVSCRDTGHRITRCAFLELEDHYRVRGYSTYDHAQFYRFFFCELLPLVSEAKRRWNSGGILKSTYDFQVVETGEEVLWYLPNELAGITMMLPSDY